LNELIDVNLADVDQLLVPALQAFKLSSITSAISLRMELLGESYGESVERVKESAKPVVVRRGTLARLVKNKGAKEQKDYDMLNSARHDV
jgi:hypothetical protein